MSDLNVMHSQFAKNRGNDAMAEATAAFARRRRVNRQRDRRRVLLSPQSSQPASWSNALESRPLMRIAGCVVAVPTLLRKL